MSFVMFGGHCIVSSYGLNDMYQVGAGRRRISIVYLRMRRSGSFSPPQVLMEKVRRLSQTGNPRRTVVTVEELHSKDHVRATQG